FVFGAPADGATFLDPEPLEHQIEHLGYVVGFMHPQAPPCPRKILRGAVPYERFIDEDFPDGRPAERKRQPPLMPPAAMIHGIVSRSHATLVPVKRTPI